MAESGLSLLVRRTHSSEAVAPARRRGLAWLLPLGLVVGFAVLLVMLFGERLLPAREVFLATVVTVAEASDEAVSAPLAREDAFDGPVLFQASGWIEPDPLPIKATALVSGVVDEVYALEGQRVEQGALIATLISDDARLDLATAEASRDVSLARAAASEAGAQVAQEAITTLSRRVEAGRAELDLRRDAAERLLRAGRESVPEGEIVQARLRVAAQEAEVAAMESELKEGRARWEQARAAMKEAQAAVALGQTEVERRRLALERTRIVAPVAGRILRLLAAPGQQRMLGSDNPDSGTIAYLYDPERLQARIDVPLAEAARMQVDQAVRVRTNFLPDTVFRGTVTRITGEADLQRNTLQAKVAIHDPDERLRPDMLCRAEFLAPARQGAVAQGALGSATERVRLFVPEGALLDREGTRAGVWVLDEERRRVERREVTLGQQARAGFLRVREGLSPGDRVVVNPPEDLKSGMRVKERTSNE